jgi:dTDP-4-dehydrorhamnose reductase
VHKDSKILITGSTGLVGSALLNFLKDLGFKNVFGSTRANCNLLDFIVTRNYLD